MMRQYYGEEKGRVYVKYEKKKKAVTHIVAIRIIAAATTSAGSSQ